MAEGPVAHCRRARDGREFVLRRAVQTDAEALMAYATRLFAEPDLYLSVQPGEVEFTAELERDFVASHDWPNALLLLATADGQVVGCCGCRGGRQRVKRHTALLGISVAREWRGRGVGTALLQSVLAWARDNPQLHRVELEVYASNTGARRLYERMGFVVEGVRRDALHIRGRYEDELVMGLLVDGPPATGRE